jgi:hypothetical protein
MSFDDRLRDRQPEPGSLDRPARCGPAAEEGVEELSLVGAGDARAGVAHLQGRVPVLGCRRDGDAAATRRELDRVRDQVVHHLREADPIAFETTRRPVAQRQLDLLRGRGRPGRGDALFRELSEIDVAHVERQRSVPRLSDEQEVADETHESLRVPLHDLEERPLLRCAGVRVVVSDQLEIAEDRRERCAQLMRDRRDELVAQPDQLLRARGVVAVDAPRPPLHVELPDESSDEGRGADQRDDQREPRVRVRHARGATERPDLRVDAVLEPRKLSDELPLARRGDAAVASLRQVEDAIRSTHVRDIGSLETVALVAVVLANLLERVLNRGDGLSALARKLRADALLGLRPGQEVLKPERGATATHRARGQELEGGG